MNVKNIISINERGNQDISSSKSPYRKTIRVERLRSLTFLACSRDLRFIK